MSFKQVLLFVVLFVCFGSHAFARTERVREGDTLSKIALRNFHNSHRPFWNKIHNAQTHQQIPEDQQDSLQIGQELEIDDADIAPAFTSKKEIENFCAKPTITNKAVCFHAFNADEPVVAEQPLVQTQSQPEAPLLKQEQEPQHITVEQGKAISNPQTENHWLNNLLIIAVILCALTAFAFILKPNLLDFTRRHRSHKERDRDLIPIAHFAYRPHTKTAPQPPPTSAPSATQEKAKEPATIPTPPQPTAATYEPGSDLRAIEDALKGRPSQPVMTVSTALAPNAKLIYHIRVPSIVIKTELNSIPSDRLLQIHKRWFKEQCDVLPHPPEIITSEEGNIVITADPEQQEAVDKVIARRQDFFTQHQELQDRASQTDLTVDSILT